MAGFRLNEPKSGGVADRGTKRAGLSDSISNVKHAGVILALCGAAGVCAALLILSLIRSWNNAG